MGTLRNVYRQAEPLAPLPVVLLMDSKTWQLSFSDKGFERFQEHTAKMIQVLGIMLILCPIGFTVWWIFQQKPGIAAMISVCGISALAGFALFINERITEITIENIGTIKAATQQATTDAIQIAQLRDRITAQAATVDLVAKEASESKRLTEELSKKNDRAEKKLKDLDDALKTGSEAVEELKRRNMLLGLTDRAIADGKTSAFKALYEFAESASEESWREVALAEIMRVKLFYATMTRIKNFSIKCVDRIGPVQQCPVRKLQWLGVQKILKIGILDRFFA